MYNKQLLILFFFFFFSQLNSYSQGIKLPENCPNGHPRLLTTDKGKESLKKLIANEEWAQKTYDQAVKSIEKYVFQHQTDSTWIVSRLQMYWKSHATNVYVKGPVYSHADGNAPVPTVRFTGTRDAVTSYAMPKLEDILPYMDDDRGLYFANRSKPGNPLEWVEQSKTGTIIQSINRQIMSMAQTAAFIYWYSDDERYAKFAFDLFDTYMMGLYYRSEPIDLNHSHIQTLVGLSSFEVIHEDIVDELTSCYDFLYSYLEKRASAKMPYYAESFKKWADLIIKNGVPFNNWDLIEARFVAYIALILEDNKSYKDGKGFQYYLNEIFNNNYTRQWSIPRLMEYGYDFNTGIWNESPGYSQNVTTDFTEFVQMFDKTLGIDLLPQLPVLNKAVEVLPQYLYPNGYIVAFGDTYYGRLNVNSIQQMIINAQKYNKPEQEILFTKILKTVRALSGEQIADYKASSVKGFKSLFSKSEFVLKDTIQPLNYKDIVTSTFYAPNVSWLVQRNGFDAYTGLMVSQVGSLGNHAHSNGIAMELYGKGMILAPEAGIGTSYFQADYKEYYSQFPAHNTVVVNGISSYPEMRSNHAFDVLSCYPESGKKNGYFPFVTFSGLYFLEPETNADQNRMMSIIRTGDSTGYYVDIFRSKCKNGKDKRHDYFYHNIGQELSISGADGTVLELKPSDNLAFAQGDMFAYDYIWDKKSVTTGKDVQATFKLSITGKEDIFMNMWMKGVPDREIFSVKTPYSKAITRGLVPKEIGELPVPAIVARQTGEAWTRPFVAVFEPYTSKEPQSVKSIQSFEPENAGNDFVGLIVENKDKSRQYIVSSGHNLKPVKYNDFEFEGTYGVISEKAGKLQYLFLGNGSVIEKAGYAILSKDNKTAAALVLKDDKFFFTSNNNVTLILPDIYKKGKIILTSKTGIITLEGKRFRQNGRLFISFELPKMEYQNVVISIK